MSSKQLCPLCDCPMEDPPAVHDVARCEKTELLNGRKEIVELKRSIDEWRDAWYHLREIIGNLWWHHEAIDDEQKLAYYRNYLAKLREIKNAVRI